MNVRQLGAVAACLAVGALVFVATPRGVEGEAFAQSSGCVGSVQGKIAYGSSKTWAAQDLETLCKGAESSPEPGKCFERVMTSNAVNYGGGTTWIPGNALKLCAGATDAKARIACFEGKIAQKVPWQQATAECAKATSTPAAAPAGTAELTVQEVQRIVADASSTTSMMECVGPLKVEVKPHASPPAGRTVHEITVDFKAARSAADIKPGECWRRGGFQRGVLIGANASQDRGRLYYLSDLGKCPLFTNVTLEGGKVASFTMNDRIVGTTLFGAGLGPARFSLDTRLLSGRFGSSDSNAITVFKVENPPNASWRPAYCE